MDKEIKRRRELCERADDADWGDFVARSRALTAAQKAFLKEHSPGLVNALWAHFEATRNRCGCASAAHERPSCPARLIERLLRDEESS